MSATGLNTLPYITITQGATTYRVPTEVRQDREGNVLGPVPVAVVPKLSFPQPLAISGPTGGEYRRNYDIDEVFLNDWSDGLSVDKYPAGVAPSGANSGELDTRAGAYLTPPRLATDLGSMSALDTQKRYLNPGFSGASILGWGSITSSAYYYAGGTTWTIAQSGASNLKWSDACEGLGFVWAVGANAVPTTGVYRTSNGTAYDTMARGAMTTPTLICCFDEKVFVLDVVGSLVTLYISSDLPTAAAGAGTWSAGNTFRISGSEALQRLFVWQYPPDRGQPTIWAMTHARLLYYDYYAPTPTWKEFFRFRSPYETTTATNICDAYVSPFDGNLYTCCNLDDFITQFTGNAVTRMKLNRRGGTPSAQRLAPLTLSADREHVYVFCGVSTYDGTAAGGVIAIAPGGAIHHVYRPTTAGHSIFGGFVGSGVVLVARYETPGTLRVLQLSNSDPTVAPHLRSTSATYDSASKTLTSGWLHCNMLNVNKRLLYFEADCLKMDGSPGLEASCTVQIEYQPRTSTSWTSAGTLTSASTFPAVLAISGGLSFKEFRVRITLQRGSTSTSCPIVAAIKCGYRPQPKRRLHYTFRLDVRDNAPAFAGAERHFNGQTASKLRAFLDDLANNDNDHANLFLTITYGGRGNSLDPRYTSISLAEAQVQAQHDPTTGAGLYLLVASDVSAPSSG